MATDTTYNGWANRETWNVALWLGNDEGFYRDAVAFGRRTLPAHDEETKVEQFCRNLFGDMTPDGDSLDNVDWSEIVADIKEMAGVEEEDEDESKGDLSISPPFDRSHYDMQIDAEKMRKGNEDA